MKHICPDCRRAWKKSRTRKEKAEIKRQMRARALKLKHFYPAYLYHDQETRCCLRHHANRLAGAAKRRAAKIQATPAWADQKAIKAVYREAAELNQKTKGVKYHVDHIAPLRGRLVCGLHVAGNLQIIKSTENIRKSNKFSSFCTGEETRQGAETECDTGIGS